jgi:FtsP/CotA-like multicopper oxidase with cupredoxin domain
MQPINRRQFLKYSSCGLAAIAVGTLDLPYIFRSRAFAANQTVDLAMEAALVEMIDQTQVFHWLFSSPATGPTFPGPVIFAVTGDQITINVSNNLDGNHAFQIVGTNIATGVIPSGGNASLTFTAPAAGTYLYMDPLNAPVNRVLGLHGLLVVMPVQPENTPYSLPTDNVRRLFNDLGTTALFPGEPWNPDPSANRTRLWLFNSIDPRFNELAQRGAAINPEQFTATFLPRYFTMNGKSGAFASHDKNLIPSGRIGQPHLIRIVNAGMAAHSPHMHANHFFVLSVNNEVRDNLFFIDSMSVMPLDRIDILLPFERPPDIAGDERIPLRDLIPNELKLVLDTPQSPLAWPMHCHMEMSQTAAGGNYPQGLVTHLEITGDVDGIDFPVIPMGTRRFTGKDGKSGTTRIARSGSGRKGG